MNWDSILVLLLALLIAKPAFTIIYNIFFHPLARFPGPKIFGASQIPYTFVLLTGNIGYTIKSLHDKYGTVVRTAPNELVFCSSNASRDIYLRRGKAGGGALLMKDPASYTLPPGGVHSILSVRDDADHSRYRRLLAHAFSDKALQDQAPLLEKYVNLLMRRLREADGPQNMVDWYNFIAFDVIGDLTLGESFDCLQESKSHPWVAYLMKYFKSSAFLSAARRYPLLTPVLLQFIPKEIIKGRMQHAQFTKEKVEKRMAAGSERGDFMTYVLRHNNKDTGMTKEEIIPTFSILLLGGSETTATLLSAVTFYLLRYPETMEKLSDEIRSSFGTEDKITQVSVNKLKYLLAVLDEAMRIHPPTPRGGPRVVGREGEVIDGVWVPGGTIVTVATYSTNRSSRNWTDPEKFVPERWFDPPPPRYMNDNKASFQPFSLGPRNCIGRNLAYAEMRLILARLLWNFDLELQEESKNWVEGMKMYLTWEKPKLMVRLKSRF